MLSSACNNFLATHHPPCFLLISSLGLLTLLHTSISLLRWLYASFLRPPKNLTTYGSWAVITAPTDGIGRAFAHSLAQNGLNLVLVGRNLTKLDKVSLEIRTEFPNIKIKIVVVDFNSKDCVQTGVDRIEETIRELDVGLLINNVGTTYDGAWFFHEVEEKMWMGIVRVNLEGTTRVTRTVLRRMVERRRGGAIVNIGSGAAIVVPSHPLFAIYAATKAYVDQLSRSLYVEYKHYGIDVQCQVPLYVATKMSSRVASIKESSMFVPSPEEYGKAGIRQIGFEARSTPYWGHSVQWCLARFVPASLLDAWRLSIGIKRRAEHAPFSFH